MRTYAWLVLVAPLIACGDDTSSGMPADADISAPDGLPAGCGGDDVPVIEGLQGARGCTGDAVTLEVTAVGESLSYQWRKDGDELPGQTAQQLAFATAAESDTGLYEVIVANECGMAMSRAVSLSVAPCHRDFRITKIAETGETVPSRPTETYRRFGNTDPSINNDGLVAYQAAFDGDNAAEEGLYTYKEGVYVRRLDDGFGQPSAVNPPAPTGGNWNGFSATAINLSGNILFRGALNFGDADQGGYLHTGTEVKRIVDNNVVMPFVPERPGRVFTNHPFFVFPTLNDAGYAVTYATFKTAVDAEHGGVYIGNTEGLQRVADALMEAPGQPGAQFTDFDNRFVLSPNGVVAFAASLEGGTGRNGIFRYDRLTSELRRVADATMTPPDQSDRTRFLDFTSPPCINGTDRVVFAAVHVGGRGSTGIYREDGAGGLETVVDNSGAYEFPGRAPGSVRQFAFPVTNARGDVVFFGQFGSAANDRGLYMMSDGKIVVLAESEQPAPGVVGATFWTIGSAAMNRHGHVVFTGITRDPAGFQETLFFFNGRELVRVADKRTSPDVLGVQSRLFFHVPGAEGSGGEDGRAMTLNDRDQFVFRIWIETPTDPQPDPPPEAIFLVEPVTAS